ncbi:MAG: CoA-binding protein, partial [Dehalococcoidia bacterium]|nr:CoA-binding protein [Dehalococcoidia bacterium]
DDYSWLRNMSDFKGKVYSVQVDPNDIAGIEEMGIPNFKSLTEIPEPVDYVVVAVPRRVVPFVLKDAIAKEVKTVHMFTSGFAESGSEDGIQAQQQITQMAQEAGVLVIGPNCMGVFNPHVGMRFGPGQQVDNIGSVTIISQSGAHASAMTQGLQASGIGVNTSISFGNAIMLDSPDLLQYFVDDPKTSVICAYIEGPKDGRRVFTALREVAPCKPVLVWKGGQSAAGRRSAASHTGSLAGSIEVWDAAVRQAGAIQAGSLDEVIDVTKMLTYLAPTTGDRIGIIGGSGGQSVSMSDDFSKAGLNVPTLSGASLEQMASFFQLVGASYFNPVDIGGINRSNMETILDLLTNDPNVDIVAMMRGIQRGRRTQEEMVAELELYGQARDKSGKPMIAMFWTPVPYPDNTAMEEIDKTLREMNIPTFSSPSRAALALKKMIDYHRFREDLVKAS